MQKLQDTAKPVFSKASATRESIAAQQQAQPAVSVVVPTCGRRELLQRCLRALIAQHMEPHRYEIVVVDDAPAACRGRTRELVEQYAAQAAGQERRIVYLANPGPHGPAAARNRGWRAARGAVIAFTDDDTVPAPDWLRHGLAAMEEGVDVVCGRVVMPLPDTPTDYERDASRLESAEFVTANCLCRRSALERLGGFDEQFRFAWREDSDLHFRLIKAGMRIARAQHAVVVHPVRAAGWAVSLSQQKKIQFDALLYKKHPRLYRERIRAAPRWDYYLIVAALALGLGATLAQQWHFALAALALWLGMSARFFLQRLERNTRTASHIAGLILTSALIPPIAVFWRAVGAWKFRSTLL
jgi:GT2 family glycosyltransferase